jgi:quercetin dioxygenase-like cupin family protein
VSDTPAEVRIINVPATAHQGSRSQHDGWLPVHGAPAVGHPMHSNGHLGADLIHVAAGDQFPVHTHPGDHLLYCVSGHGTITVDQVVYEIHPGDLYMVDGMVPHAVGAITNHTILAIGSPHKAVDSPERMTWVDWQGNPIDSPLAAG